MLYTKITKNIKIILFKIKKYSRLFLGMFLGGFLSLSFVILSETIKLGGRYYSAKEIYFYFVIGFLGIGIVIGGFLQEAHNNKINN